MEEGPTCKEGFGGVGAQAAGVQGEDAEGRGLAGQTPAQLQQQPPLPRHLNHSYIQHFISLMMLGKSAAGIAEEVILKHVKWNEDKAWFNYQKWVSF